jgi:hypothetical protein
MLKIQKIFLFRKIFLKENKESDAIFGNISFVESKLINYSTNMC